MHSNSLFCFVFIFVLCCFLDTGNLGSSSLRGNGNLSPRILDLRGGGRRKSNFNFE